MTAARTSMLTMENIRCFSKGELLLRPLTVLLGETSSGKTTSLACHQASHNLLGKRKLDPTSPPFNQYPHSMGTFQDIFRHNKSATGKATRTTPRVKLTHALGKISCRSTYTENKRGMIEIEKLQLYDPGNKQIRLELKLADIPTIGKSKYSEKSGLSVNIPRKNFLMADLGKYLKNNLLTHFRGISASDGSQPRVVIDHIIRSISNSLPNHGLISIPSKNPVLRRSYEINDQFDLNGYDAIPQRLFSLRNDDAASYELIIGKINQFGKNAEMFEEFHIQEERGETPKFKFVVSNNGNATNVCDMGSSVWPVMSQVIAVELEALSDGPRQYHFQHMEGHSHPRLHAELFKWICGKIKEGNHFMIETHSDYILMRITIEICAENIIPDDVSLAYFDKRWQDQTSVIHNMRLGDNGLVTECTDFFRKFYYEETERYIFASNRK